MNHVDKYDSSSITVLSGLEAVRHRPGMYIGDLHDGSGLHHLLWEVLGNVIDQHLARRVRHVRVEVDGPWVTVEDDGPGIPACASPGKPSALETVLTTLHAGATWDGHIPHIHLDGWRGVGLSAVNAVCERFEVESRWEGRVWRMAFERGERSEPLRCVACSDRSGLRIRFRADRTLFATDRLDVALVAPRVRELAWMNPLLEVRWQGRTLPNREGLRGFVAELTAHDASQAPILSADRFVEDTWVDVALRIAPSATPEPASPVAAPVAAPGLRTFVNTCASKRGTHIRGFWEGAGDAMRLRSSLARELLAPRLVAVLHVGVFQPRFDNPVRDNLLSSSARLAVRRVVGELLRRCREPALRASTAAK